MQWWQIACQSAHDIAMRSRGSIRGGTDVTDKGLADIISVELLECLRTTLTTHDRSHVFMSECMMFVALLINARNRTNSLRAGRLRACFHSASILYALESSPLLVSQL